jgi:diguanylate cyclase (GGDEF)-like protein
MIPRTVGCVAICDGPATWRWGARLRTLAVVSGVVLTADIRDALDNQLVLFVIAAVAAGAVVLAGSGAGFWLCLPAILLAMARSPTRRGMVLSGTAVLIAAVVPLLAFSPPHPLPPVLLVLLVVASSAAVLVAARERWERERDALRRSALSDQLTGLANRRLLLGRIEYEIARHARLGRSFALVMIDLDGFKLINDRFGHRTGDELLCDLARALERTIRTQDTAARLGGDEFCVLAPETEARGTARLVDRVLEAVRSIPADTERIRAGAGIAVFPHDGSTPDALLDAADQRLMAAKRDRRREPKHRHAA